MLSQEQLQQFEQDGFLCIEQVLQEADMQPIRQEYDVLLNEVAHRFGLADVQWLSQSFDVRYASLIQQYPSAYEYLDISLPMVSELAPDAGIHAGPAVFSLLSHPALLDIAEQLIGPEVYSNPVQHVRLKPPEALLDMDGLGNSNIARTHWHQDSAVVLEQAEQTPMLTVWVAMTEASVERGCMEAVRGSHHWPQLALHCPGKTGLGEIFIPDELANVHDRVPLEVAAGGVVLLHQKTWHGAGPNTSDHLRWSFDLRYQPSGLSTGRDFFPGFLARSQHAPQDVLRDAKMWRESWMRARHEISSGSTEAVFNTRWQAFRDDPLCA